MLCRSGSGIVTHASHLQENSFFYHNGPVFLSFTIHAGVGQVVVWSPCHSKQSCGNASWGIKPWCLSPALSIQALLFLKIIWNFQQFWTNSGHVLWFTLVPALQSDPQGPLGPNIMMGNQCFKLAKRCFSPCEIFFFFCAQS